MLDRRTANSAQISVIAILLGVKGFFYRTAKLTTNPTVGAFTVGRAGAGVRTDAADAATIVGI
jgi:hypothetical protein